MNLTPENTHYFSDARFRQMAKHPIFLNAARGGNVDEAALIRAPDSGRTGSREAEPCRLRSARAGERNRDAARRVLQRPFDGSAPADELQEPDRLPDW